MHDPREEEERKKEKEGERRKKGRKRGRKKKKKTIKGKGRKTETRHTYQHHHLASQQQIAGCLNACTKLALESQVALSVAAEAVGIDYRYHHHTRVIHSARV